MLAATSAAAQAVRPAPLVSGEIAFVIHSTFVGAVRGRAPVERASFTGDALDSVSGSLEVLAARMQTGNGTRDGHMREAMRADSFPVIRFALDSVRPDSSAPAAPPDSTPVGFYGRLTIHGVTRPVRAGGWVRATATGVDVTATLALDMRDYGIKPPVRALVLRVAPDVAITARLSFGPKAGP